MSVPSTPIVIKQEPKDSESDWTPNITSEILSAIKMEIMEVKKEIKSEPVDNDTKDNIIGKIALTKKEKRLEKNLRKAARNALNPKPTTYRKNYNSAAFYRGHKRRQISTLRTEPRSHSPSDSVVINDAIGTKVDYFMRLTNIPQNWSYDDLWGLLKRFQCDLALVKRLSMDKPSGSATKCVKVHLVSSEACSDVKDKLASANVNGKKLNIYCHYIDSNGDTTDSDDTVSTSEPRSKRRKKNPKTWRPDTDVHATDPAGLYGLKAEFLHTLQITPPIDRWVQVSNFRCGKRELEEIMCLAGDVLIINNVYNQVPKTANVMYKHPLEAVQAVSMLNDQMHYSNKLTVKMATNMSLISLPTGLQCVGPGLGAYGKPLRDIVSHYERFVRKQTNRIDKTAFQSLDKILPFDNDEHLKKKEKVTQRVNNNNQTEKNVNATSKEQNDNMDTQTDDNMDTQNDDGSQSEIQHENPNQDIDMADDNTQSNTQSDVGDENSQDSQNTNQNSQNVDENSQDSQNTENNIDQNSQNDDDSSQNDAIDGTDQNIPEKVASNSEAEQISVVESKRKTLYTFETSSDGSDSENSVELVPSSVSHEIVDLDEESDLDQPDLDQTETVSKSNQGSSSRSNSNQNTPSISPNFPQNGSNNLDETETVSKSTQVCNNTSPSNSNQTTPSITPNFPQNGSNNTQNTGPNHPQNMPSSHVGPNNAQNCPQVGSLMSQNVPRPSGQNRMSGPSPITTFGPISGPMMGANPNRMRMNAPGQTGSRIFGSSGTLLQNPISGPRPNLMQGPGPNSGPMVPGPIRGPGQIHVPMLPNPMRGPGPNQGPMRGPGPNQGQMRGPGPNQGPMVPNPMRGPGPSQGPMRGPGPNQGPMVPNPMSGQMRQFGPNPNPMIGPNPMSMNMPGPNRPMNMPRPMMPGPNGPMNMPGPNARMGGPMGMAGPNGTSDTVRLSNLPLSTTFPLLSDKMGECGQVMSLQLTSPGCAVVRFNNNAQASNCWQRYHNNIIQGNKVCVTYI